MAEVVHRPDYPTVPDALKDTVCRCGGDRAFCDPYQTETKPRLLAFPWWVCAKCFKPAPLNALNARLIRECEMCEDPYFITTYPDRMNLCPLCL